ncbi:MAG: hypothetical protein ACOX6T_23285 [Myxococcales bacterium]|jgi:hypothetical protein
MRGILKRLLVVAAASVLAAGCAATCEDACTTTSECVEKLGGKPGSVAQCTSKCEAAKPVCSDEKYQDMLDCLSQMKCENETQYMGEIIVCAGHCDPDF